MSKINVLIVDDSAFMRKVLADILSKDPSINVIGIGRNGQDGIKKVIELKPDVVTMDVEMPVMDGLQALQEIMEKQPTPVVMLSTLTQEGADVTLKALEYGAIDFLAKPGGSISLNIKDVEQEIITKVKMASKAKPKPKVVDRKKKTDSFEVDSAITNKRVARTAGTVVRNFKGQKDLGFPLILIGTSTGGPRALHEVIRTLNTSMDAAVLIVQHMPPTFTKSLANRLNTLTDFEVKEAEDGDVIAPKRAFVAPGDRHLRIDLSGKIPKVKLTKDEEVNGHRPSVDVMYDSAVDNNIKNIIAVIMTGMGYDGRDGMVKLKKNGAITIGEAEDTCVVYGMPKAAFEAGAVDFQVGLDDISKEIFRNYSLIKSRG